MKRPGAAVWVLIAVGVLIAIAFLCCRSTAPEVIYPIERAKLLFQRHVWTRVKGVWHASSVYAENEALKRELDTYRLVKDDLKRSEAENARLRKTLGYATRNEIGWVPAGVLSSQGGAVSSHETIRVDKGSLEGIEVGAIVTVPEGLVGRVTAVTPHTAEVTLVTDCSVKVACEVETDDLRRPRGILSGGSARFLVLKHMSNAENIPPVYTRVITSGRGGIFPRGLQVGYCNSKDGEVVPSVDFASLEDVFIRREK